MMNMEVSPESPTLEAHVLVGSKPVRPSVHFFFLPADQVLEID